MTDYHCKVIDWIQDSNPGTKTMRFTVSESKESLSSFKSPRSMMYPDSTQREREGWRLS